MNSPVTHLGKTTLQLDSLSYTSLVYNLWRHLQHTTSYTIWLLADQRLVRGWHTGVVQEPLYTNHQRAGVYHCMLCKGRQALFLCLPLLTTLWIASYACRLLIADYKEFCPLIKKIPKYKKTNKTCFCIEITRFQLLFFKLNVGTTLWDDYDCRFCNILITNYSFE